MGFLDGMVGGMVGAEMINVVNGLIEKHGGVQGIVSQLQSQGLGPTVQSWVAQGPNAPAGERGGAWRRVRGGGAGGPPGRAPAKHKRKGGGGGPKRGGAGGGG